MTVSELIEKLLEYPLDAPVHVFYDRYDGGGDVQGEEEPIVIDDGGYIMIVAENDQSMARHWIER